MSEPTDASGGLSGRWKDVANMSAVGAMMVLLFLIVYWIRQDGLGVVRDFQNVHREDMREQRGEFTRAIDAFKQALKDHQTFEREMREQDRAATTKLTTAVEHVLNKVTDHKN